LDGAAENQLLLELYHIKFDEKKPTQILSLQDDDLLRRGKEITFTFTYNMKKTTKYLDTILKRSYETVIATIFCGAEIQSISQNEITLVFDKSNST